jgi:hypothetical protein
MSTLPTWGPLMYVEIYQAGAMVVIDEHPIHLCQPCELAGIPGGGPPSQGPRGAARAGSRAAIRLWWKGMEHHNSNLVVNM